MNATSVQGQVKKTISQNLNISLMFITTAKFPRHGPKLRGWASKSLVREAAKKLNNNYYFCTNLIFIVIRIKPQVTFF